MQFGSWHWQEILPFFEAFRPVLVTIWPTIKWVAGVKRPGREADHLPESSTNVKYGWNCTSPPDMYSWHAQEQPSPQVQIFFFYASQPDSDMRFEPRTFCDIHLFCNLMLFSIKNMNSLYTVLSDLMVRYYNRLN